MVAKGRKERKNYLSTFPCCQIFFVWQKLEPFLFWKVMLHLTSQVILTLKKLKVAAQPVLPAVSSVACHCHCRSQLEDFCSSCCDRMAYHSSQWNIVFKLKKINKNPDRSCLEASRGFIRSVLGTSCHERTLLCSPLGKARAGKQPWTGSLRIWLICY